MVKVCGSHEEMMSDISEIKTDIRDIRNGQMTMLYALLAIIFGTIAVSQVGTPWYIEVLIYGIVVPLVTLLLMMFEVAYHRIKQNPFSDRDQKTYRELGLLLFAMFVISMFVMLSIYNLGG